MPSTPRPKTMKAYWFDASSGRESDAKQPVDMGAAGLIWSDEIRGKGSFMGLIDDVGNTVQFYIDDHIPDGVDDARHLRIVLMDFPQPGLRGSFAKRVTIGEVHGLIESVFAGGADHCQFEGLTFAAW